MIDLLKTKHLKEKIRNNPQEVENLIEEEQAIGICITNKRGYYKAVNQRYCDIYGFKKSELVGNHFTVVVPNDLKDRLITLHNKFIENEFELLRNWTVQDKNGQEFKIQADAGFFTNIFDKSPHKITFVHVEK